MARLLISGSSSGQQAVPMGVGLFVAVVVLVALCAKKVRRVSPKLVTRERSSTPGGTRISPKLLLTTLSNKAIPFLQMKKNGGELEADDGFGEGGLWQRDILMGEKCQPLDFSGVILYDSDGKQVPELPPRSPRTTPLQSSFSFPVVVADKVGS
ncbi:uncharacterized protein [Aristolochia californica]|uniref:uncharacterized protein n=1 Tax=Aristolochia californica TaxID=171875 RepID=UPI0035DD87A9